MYIPALLVSCCPEPHCDILHYRIANLPNFAVSIFPTRLRAARCPTPIARRQSLAGGHTRKRDHNGQVVAHEQHNSGPAEGRGGTRRDAEEDDSYFRRAACR